MFANCICAGVRRHLSVSCVLPCFLSRGLGSLNGQASLLHIHEFAAGGRGIPMVCINVLIRFRLHVHDVHLYGCIAHASVSCMCLSSCMRVCILMTCALRGPVFDVHVFSCAHIPIRTSEYAGQHQIQPSSAHCEVGWRHGVFLFLNTYIRRRGRPGTFKWGVTTIVA